MQIAILDYKAGNTRSVRFALERLGAEVVLSDQPEVLRAADRVIFPGVGHARPAMEYLREHKLDRLLLELEQPVLGICLGLQLLCEHTEEGDVDCLGVFPVKVKRFPKTPDLKVPHMGWNTLQDIRGEMFQHITPSDSFYFVHSYYAEAHPDYTSATTDYGVVFSAALQRDNYRAAQFHPEKSADIGAVFLKNFLDDENLT